MRRPLFGFGGSVHETTVACGGTRAGPSCHTLASVVNAILVPLVPQTIQEEYAEARQRAREETGLPLTAFPAAYPWTVEQVLDTDFWPEGETTP